MFVNYSNSTIQCVQNFAARIYDLNRSMTISLLNQEIYIGCVYNTTVLSRSYLDIEMYDGSSAWVLSDLYVNNKTQRIWTSYNQEISTAKHSSSNFNRTESVFQPLSEDFRRFSKIVPKARRTFPNIFGIFLRRDRWCFDHTATHLSTF